MAKTIAILGASRMRNKFGNKAVRAYQQAGYEVYPVNLNPREGDIEGLKTYQSLAQIPVSLDRISLYLPPPVTLELLGEIAAKGAGQVWFNPGTYDAEVLRRAQEAGIPAVEGCSIVDLGMTPSQFPDA